MQIFWRVCVHTSSGVNALLDPFLFSFRNEKFQNEFKKSFFKRLFQNSVHTVPIVIGEDHGRFNKKRNSVHTTSNVLREDKKN